MDIWEQKRNESSLGKLNSENVGKNLQKYPHEKEVSKRDEMLFSVLSFSENQVVLNCHMDNDTKSKNLFVVK